MSGAGGNGNDVPKSWEWYGEAIKWFIAIAAALMAFGFERAADQELVAWMWWVYLVGAGLLGLSILLGLFAYLQLLGAAGLREKQPQNPAEQARYDHHVRRLSAAYQACVATLAFGVLSSSVAFAASIWPDGRTSAPAAITVEAVDKTGTPLVVRRSGTKTEVLTSSGASTLTWKEIAIPGVDAARADASQNRGYGAIIDAGSTGSRLWIFKWAKDAGGDPRVEPAMESLKGKTAAGADCPLTNMISDETGTCACLKSLLAQGHQKLASAAGPAATGIPLWVKATGGVRKAPMKDQIDVLTRTDRCLKPNKEYSWQRAEAIAGSTEALYAWVAVNYAHETLQPYKQTLGIAEIGGESAQVAFQVPMPIATTQRGHVAAVPLHAGTLYVYGFSDVLGREALRRYFKEKKVGPDECALDAEPKHCLARIDHFLCTKPYARVPCSQRVPEFMPGSGVKFIGLSNFDFAVFNSGFDQGSLLDVQKRAKAMCGNDPGMADRRKEFIRSQLPDEFRDDVCLNALYTTRVAEYAWALPLDAVTRPDSGVIQEWPLGAMFLEIAQR